MAKQGAARRGRPALEETERRNRNFTFRSRERLHQQLQAAAKQNGKSVSEEIEGRLDASFENQQFLTDALELSYGRELAGALIVLGEVMKDAGRLAGLIKYGSVDGSVNWWRDAYAFDQAVVAAKKVLTSMAPSGDVDPPGGTPLKIDGLPVYMGTEMTARLGSDIAMTVLREVASAGLPTSAHAIERAPRVDKARHALGPILDRIKRSVEGGNQ